MDYSLLSLLASLLALLRFGGLFRLVRLDYGQRIGFFTALSRQGASKYAKTFGGFWWLFIGAPLAAWWVVNFFLSSSYQLNLNTLISTLQTFSGPALPVVLAFIGLWAIFALGYGGAKAIYMRSGRGRKR